VTGTEPKPRIGVTQDVVTLLKQRHDKRACWNSKLGQTSGLTHGPMTRHDPAKIADSVTRDAETGSITSARALQDNNDKYN